MMIFIRKFPHQFQFPSITAAARRFARGERIIEHYRCTQTLNMRIGQLWRDRSNLFNSRLLSKNYSIERGKMQLLAIIAKNNRINVIIKFSKYKYTLHYIVTKVGH